METAEIKVTIRCRPFSGVLITAKCLVDLSTETIRVRDSIAGYYTLCHSLSNRDAGRVLAAARKSGLRGHV